MLSPTEAGHCYLAGAVLGIIFFLYMLWRDGICNTATYWLNPPSFESPAEHLGSLAILKHEFVSPRPVSIFATLCGLGYGLFASVLTGTLFGGFALVGLALATKDAP